VTRRAGSGAVWPWLVALALMLATLLLWRELNNRETAQLQALSAVEVRRVREAFTDRVKAEIRALQRMAARQARVAFDAAETAAWKEDARRYMRDFPTYRGLWWLRPDGSQQAHVADGQNFAFAWLGCVERAAREGRVTVSSARPVAADGGWSFAIAAPVDGGERGFIVASFDVVRLMETVLYEQREPGWRLAVRQGEESIYGRLPANPAALRSLREAVLPFPGAAWRLTLWLDPSRVAVHASPLPTVVLMSGWTLALLLGGVLHFIRQATERARANRIITERLEREIDRHKQTEARLRRQGRNLVAVNSELEQFAYIASHDLKAPLRAVSNLVGWLEEDLEGKLNDETRRMMGLMRERVLGMDALIEGLLSYSRVGRDAGAREWVDTADMIREVTELLTPPPGFRIIAESPLPRFRTDPLALSQVLTNLIGNAVSHHDRSDGEVRIRVVEQTHHYEFMVIDDGPGIPPERYERIFELFQSYKTHTGDGGSGIGLALVRKLVRKMGGAVWVEPAPGRGTAFHFTWPRATEGEDG